MSSVNYDPVKAHEYYEKHKKTTSRRSTKGMNNTQKEQWSFAKAQLNEQYKGYKEALTNNAKEQRAQLSANAKSKIKAIQDRMKGLSKDQKVALREQISAIRGNLKTDKLNLTDSTKQAKTDAKAIHENDLDTAYARIKGN